MDCFSYHCSKHITRPEEKKLTKNIKGLELEIDDRDAFDFLDDLIYDDIITSPKNEGNTNNEIAIEYDGSVDWELVFRADTIRPLMKNVRILNEYGLNPENIANSSGTSCHIHYNRRYLEEKKEVFRLDLQKAVEFNSFPMYLFSGRTENTMGEWCRSTLATDISDDLLTKSKLIDRINNISYNRYNIVNYNGERTNELRIFSNHCSFDYKTIKFYLEYSDMVVDLAKLMKGKSYEQHIDECVEFIDDFMLSRPRRKIFYDKYNLNTILLKQQDLEHIRIIKLWDKVDKRINNFENRIESQNNYNNSLSFIRMVRDINNTIDEPLSIVFNPQRPNYNDLSGEVREQVRRMYDL